MRLQMQAGTEAPQRGAALYEAEPIATLTGHERGNQCC